MNHRTVIILGAVFGCVLVGRAAFGESGFTDHKVVRVTVSNQEQLDQVLSMSDAVWSCHIGIGPIDVQIAPEKLPRIEQLGLPFEVFIEDVQPLIDEQFSVVAGATFHESYHTTTQIILYLEQLAADFPDIASMEDFGGSHLGQELRGIRITGPGKGSDKPGFFFHGGQHAREWIGPAITVYAAEWLITNYGIDPVATELVDNIEWFILPVMNPDGYDYTWQGSTERLWRKNRRNNGDGTFGVDLNRNWDMGWGGEGSSGMTSSDIYRGTGPFSEEETQRMRDFIWAHPNIIAYIDFHSYSQLILWPWGFQEEFCPDQDRFVEAGTAMETALEAVHGLNYTAGPIYTTIYPASGGSADWVYGANINDRFIYGTSIELRDTGANGFLLPPSQIIPTAEENLAAIIALAQVATIPITVELNSPLPSLVGPGETLVVDLHVTERNQTFTNNDISFYYRFQPGSFTEQEMTPLGNNVYRVVLPPADCSGSVEFYAQAFADQGGTAEYPVDAPSEWISLNVGTATQILSDTLEAASAWTAGAPGDNATTGLWTRVDPVGTLAQPENDHTPNPGVMCFVTGQGVPGGTLGAADVDGGQTTLLSPIFSVPDAGTLISYARWYSNNTGAAPGEDTMNIDVSINGGGAWLPIEAVTENANAWVVHEFTLGELGLAATAQVRLRFIASDLINGSIVEAGIDDLSVRKVQCVAPNGDSDGNDVVDVLDFAAFQACMNGPSGAVVGPGCGVFNIDQDNDVDMDDYLSLSANFGPI